MVRGSPHEPQRFTEQVDLSVQVVYAPDVHFGKSNGDGITHDVHLKYVLASDPPGKEHCFKKALASMQLQQEFWKCALLLQCMIQAVVPDLLIICIHYINRRQADMHLRALARPKQRWACRPSATNLGGVPKKVENAFACANATDTLTRHKQPYLPNPHANMLLSVPPAYRSSFGGSARGILTTMYNATLVRKRGRSARAATRESERECKPRRHSAPRGACIADEDEVVLSSDDEATQSEGSDGAQCVLMFRIVLAADCAMTDGGLNPSHVFVRRDLHAPLLRHAKSCRSKAGLAQGGLSSYRQAHQQRPSWQR